VGFGPAGDAGAVAAEEFAAGHGYYSVVYAVVEVFVDGVGCGEWEFALCSVGHVVGCLVG